MKRKFYEDPRLELLRISVENGFALSAEEPDIENENDFDISKGEDADWFE